MTDNTRFGVDMLTTEQLVPVSARAAIKENIICSASQAEIADDLSILIGSSLAQSSTTPSIEDGTVVDTSEPGKSDAEMEQKDVPELFELQPSSESMIADERFISRVAGIPILQSIHRVYESSVGSSRVAKFGISSVSHVKTLCQPVLSTIEPRLELLDTFACRQLDKLEKNYPVIREPTEVVYENSKMAIRNLLWRSPEQMQASGQGAMEKIIEPASDYRQKIMQCVQMLRTAESYLDHLISKLRATLADAQMALAATWNDTSEAFERRKTETLEAIGELTIAIKHEIVATLRKSIDMISLTAVYLPAPARTLVKRIIMMLPEKMSDFAKPIDLSGNTQPTTDRTDNFAISSAFKAANRVISMANESSITMKTISNLLTSIMGLGNIPLSTFSPVSTAKVDPPNL